MKILITGINGSLGLNTAIQLYEKGYEIIGFGHSKNNFHPIINKIEFIEGDLLDKEKLKQVISTVNVIFHFGAQTGFKKTMRDYIDSNILGTQNIIDIIIEEAYSIEKIIFASSSAVYGEGAYKCTQHGSLSPINRSSSDLDNGIWNIKCEFCNNLLNPIATQENKEQYGNHIYAITKQTSEKILNTISFISDIKIINLRFSILYGPYQEKGIVPLFINKIISDQIITLNEDGNQIRDFILLTDAAKMSILAMENLFENQTYNISSNRPISLQSLINCISEILNKEANVNINGEYRLGDIRHIYLDNNKFGKTFDFYPKSDLKNDIIELLN